jgi:hypothetical protein
MTSFAKPGGYAREQFRQELLDLDPADRTLAAQLASARYDLTSAGQIHAAKRATTGTSPDHADAAVIALYGASCSGTLTLHIPRGRIPGVNRDGRGIGTRAGAMPTGTPAWQRRIVAKQLGR